MVKSREVLVIEEAWDQQRHNTAREWYCWRLKAVNEEKEAHVSTAFAVSPFQMLPSLMSTNDFLKLVCKAAVTIDVDFKCRIDGFTAEST